MIQLQDSYFDATLDLSQQSNYGWTIGDRIYNVPLSQSSVPEAGAIPMVSVDVTFVPEPGMGMAGCGVGMMVMGRRRRAGRRYGR